MNNANFFKSLAARILILSLCLSLVACGDLDETEDPSDSEHEQTEVRSRDGSEQLRPRKDFQSKEVTFEIEIGPKRKKKAYPVNPNYQPLQEDSK